MTTTVYDAIYAPSAKPDTAALGMKPIIVSGVCRTQAECNELGTQAGKANCPVCLDIEDLPANIRNAEILDVAASIQTIQQRLGWCRDGAPKGQTLDLGVFAYGPITDYWTGDPVDKALWELASKRLMPLQTGLSLYPELYTYYVPTDLSHPTDWESFAGRAIALSKSMGMARPRCFLQPFYAPDFPPTPQQGTPIPSELFRAQLDFVASQGCDIVVWANGGDFTTPHSWWTSLVDFMQGVTP